MMSMMTTDESALSRRKRQMQLAARCGALAGYLSGEVSSARTYARSKEDWRHDLEEQAARGNPIPNDTDAWMVYEAAWHTAWERARFRHGHLEYHLTSPAAKARA